VYEGDVLEVDGTYGTEWIKVQYVLPKKEVVTYQANAGQPLQQFVVGAR
jgi:hypothetical protein